MLQSLKQLYGDKLGASDGEIGHVKDFYFDDQNWAVRYLVADTGTWLSGRLVLVSPRAFGSFHEAGKVLLVNLTRKQIEASPALESHKTVSRQYEEEYHKHYGWPFYWQGGGLWGTGNFPIAETSAKSRPIETSPEPKQPDAHLRSAQAVSGYHIKASDGTIGYVCDFLMDDKSWAIGHLVIKIGHRFSGKEVLLPVAKVDRISYEESAVFVNLTMQAVEHGPAYHLPQLHAAA